MRYMVLTASAAAFLLSSCGPKKLELPADPVDRAASCAVVSAIEARTSSPNAKGGLSFDAQSKIIHHAMLAASESGTFSSDIASAVVKRMSDVEKPISDGQWQDLQAPCAAAFPAASKSEGVELPAARFDAQLGCYALDDFITRSVTSSDPEAETRATSYGDLRRKLDSPIAAGLRARGASTYEKSQAAKDKALARMSKLGTPSAVMKLCTERYS